MDSYGVDLVGDREILELGQNIVHSSTEHGNTDERGEHGRHARYCVRVELSVGCRTPLATELEIGSISPRSDCEGENAERSSQCK